MIYVFNWGFNVKSYFLLALHWFRHPFHQRCLEHLFFSRDGKRRWWYGSARRWFCSCGHLNDGKTWEVWRDEILSGSKVRRVKE